MPRTTLGTTTARAALLAGAAVLVTATLSTGTASAATYQVTNAGAGLAAHSAPSASASVVATYPNGTSLDISCQTNGSVVNGVTWVWDKLSNGAYVSDYYTTTPTIDNFSINIPNCPGTVSELNPSAYPWPSIAPTTYIADGYGYYEGECTSFAAWAVRNQGLQYTSSPNSLGNADSWHATRTEYTPHVGDIAQWADNHNGADGVGHVAYVSEVYGDGTIQVEEYNWLSAADNYTGHRYESRRIPATDPSDFLQF